MIKLGRLAAAAMLAAGLFAASEAQAAGTLKLVNGDAWGTGSAGGPFIVTTAGLPGGNGTFLTFCLERKEQIRVGTTYDANLSTAAKFNGVDGFIDPLDPRTAFLYTAFSNGTLDDLAAGAGFVWNYGTAGGTDPDGTALQNAIWYLEDELLSVSGLAQDLVDLANAAGWTDLGKVRVVNVWALGTLVGGESLANARQDVVVIVPTPEALVGGLGLLGVIAAARLRRRNSAL